VCKTGVKRTHMLTSLESNTAPECECDILLHDDRYWCPVHGVKAQEAKAQGEKAAREVSVAYTQPLREPPSHAIGIDEIEQMVEQAYYDGTITRQQRGLFRWAVRKAREVESPTRCSRCARLGGVDEL